MVKYEDTIIGKISEIFKDDAAVLDAFRPNSNAISSVLTNYQNVSLARLLKVAVKSHLIESQINYQTSNSKNDWDKSLPICFWRMLFLRFIQVLNDNNQHNYKIAELFEFTNLLNAHADFVELKNIVNYAVNYIYITQLADNVRKIDEIVLPKIKKPIDLSVELEHFRYTDIKSFFKDVGDKFTQILQEYKTDADNALQALKKELDKLAAATAAAAAPAATVAAATPGTSTTAVPAPGTSTVAAAPASASAPAANATAATAPAANATNFTALAKAATAATAANVTAAALATAAEDAIAAVPGSGNSALQDEAAAANILTKINSLFDLNAAAAAATAAAAAKTVADAATDAVAEAAAFKAANSSVDYKSTDAILKKIEDLVELVDEIFVDTSKKPIPVSKVIENNLKFSRKISVILRSAYSDYTATSDKDTTLCQNVNVKPQPNALISKSVAAPKPTQIQGQQQQPQQQPHPQQQLHPQQQFQGQQQSFAQYPEPSEEGDQDQDQDQDNDPDNNSMKTNIMKWFNDTLALDLFEFITKVSDGTARGQTNFTEIELVKFKAEQLALLYCISIQQNNTAYKYNNAFNCDNFNSEIYATVVAVIERVIKQFNNMFTEEIPGVGIKQKVDIHRKNKKEYTERLKQYFDEFIEEMKGQDSDPDGGNVSTIPWSYYSASSLYSIKPKWQRLRRYSFRVGLTHPFSIIETSVPDFFAKNQQLDVPQLEDTLKIFACLFKNVFVLIKTAPIHFLNSRIFSTTKIQNAYLTKIQTRVKMTNDNKTKRSLPVIRARTMRLKNQLSGTMNPFFIKNLKQAIQNLRNNNHLPFMLAPKQQGQQIQQPPAQQNQNQRRGTIQKNQGQTNINARPQPQAQQQSQPQQQPQAQQQSQPQQQPQAQITQAPAPVVPTEPEKSPVKEFQEGFTERVFTAVIELDLFTDDNIRKCVHTEFKSLVLSMKNIPTQKGLVVQDIQKFKDFWKRMDNPGYTTPLFKPDPDSTVNPEPEKYKYLAAIAVKKFIQNPEQTNEWAALFNFENPGTGDMRFVFSQIANEIASHKTDQAEIKKVNEVIDHLRTIISPTQHDSLLKHLIDALEISEYIELLKTDAFIGENTSKQKKIVSFSDDGKFAFLDGELGEDNTILVADQQRSDNNNNNLTAETLKDILKSNDKNDRLKNINKMIKILEKHIEEKTKKLLGSKDNEEKIKQLVQHYIAVEGKEIEKLATYVYGGKRRTLKKHKKTVKYVRPIHRKSSRINKKRLTKKKYYL